MEVLDSRNRYNREQGLSEQPRGGGGILSPPGVIQSRKKAVEHMNVSGVKWLIISGNTLPNWDVWGPGSP